MEEWVVCGSCALKHRPRQDAKCPRCGTDASAAPPVDLGGAAYPAAVAEAPAGAADTAGGAGPLPLGARLGGAALLVLALVVLFERLTLPELFQQGALSTLWVATIVDIGIGAALLAGNRAVVGWAIVRIALGALVFGGSFIAQGNWIAVVSQSFASAGLLLLLVGEAQRARVIAGVVLWGLAFSGEVVGVLSIRTGTYPLAPLFQAASVQSIPQGTINGAAQPYVLSVPHGGWKLRKPEAARKDNPLADRWLTLPIHDSHVIVIAEELPAGAAVDLQRVADFVGSNMRQAEKTLRLDDWEGYRSDHALGVSTRGSAIVQGQNLSYRILITNTEKVLFQVIAIAPVNALDDVEEDVSAIFDSFNPW